MSDFLDAREFQRSQARARANEIRKLRARMKDSLAALQTEQAISEVVHEVSARNGVCVSDSMEARCGLLGNKFGLP